MKKITTVLSIALLFGLVSCGGNENKEMDTEQEAQEMMDEMNSQMEEVADETEEVIEDLGNAMEETDSTKVEEVKEEM